MSVLDINIRQSDSEATVMLEFWGVQSNLLLPSLPGPLLPRVVAHDSVLSIGQIELFDISTESKHMSFAKLNY